MRKFTVMFVLSMLTACGAMPDRAKGVWLAIKDKDEFTDKESCVVTAGSFYYSSGEVYEMAKHYYPLIRIEDGDLHVGVRSGGKFKMPVGDVQFRVDSNKAWDISTSETPIKSIPSSPMVDALKNNPQAQEMVNNTMEATVRLMSPYTVTTGDKAASIIREMLTGTQLKFRTVGMNQAGSTTGAVTLDASLSTALAECGISIPAVTPM